MIATAVLFVILHSFLLAHSWPPWRFPFLNVVGIRFLRMYCPASLHATLQPARTDLSDAVLAFFHFRVSRRVTRPAPRCLVDLSLNDFGPLLPNLRLTERYLSELGILGADFNLH